MNIEHMERANDDGQPTTRGLSVFNLLKKAPRPLSASEIRQALAAAGWFVSEEYVSGGVQYLERNGMIERDGACYRVTGRMRGMNLERARNELGPTGPLMVVSE